MKTYEEMNIKDINFKLSMQLSRDGNLIISNGSKLESYIKGKIELNDLFNIPVNEFYYVGDSLIIVKIDDYIRVLKHYKGDEYIPCERIYFGINTTEEIKNKIMQLDSKSIYDMKHWLNDYKCIVDVSPKYSIYSLKSIIEDINYLKAL